MKTTANDSFISIGVTATAIKDAIPTIDRWMCSSSQNLNVKFTVASTSNVDCGLVDRFANLESQFSELKHIVEANAN